MNDEPPRKSFWELWLNQSGQRIVAVIMALALCFTLVIAALTAGIALLEHKPELPGIIADMLKVVLGAIVGALSVYLGTKKNGNSNGHAN